MKQTTNIIIFGLDGGTATVLGPAMAGGYMPALAELARRGRSGVLESIVPAVTPPAWAAFQTGRNPGKTGVYDFLKHMGGGRFATVNATAVTGSFLERLSGRGFRVGSLNMPLTYPPRAVNGFIVGGFLTPYDATDYTYPPELRGELAARFPGYYVFNLAKAQDEMRESPDLLASLADDLDLRRRVAVHLIEKENPDLLFVQFQTLDLVQHAFWRRLDPGHPGYDPRGRDEIFERFYRRLDRAIGEIVAAAEARAGAPVAVLAVSDHGFQRHAKTFHLCRYLIREGYSAPTAKAGRESRVLAWVKRLDPLKLRRRLLPRSARVKIPELLKKAERIEQPIDPARSAVISTGKSQEGLIFILDAGRRDELMAELKTKLLALTDPDTGGRIIKDVFAPEEIYNGPRLAEMPDLTVVPVDGYSCTGQFEPGEALIEEVVPGRDLHAGKHHPDGVYFAAGPGIEPGAGGRAGLMDVIPTLYYYLGLPVERDVDGKVRTEWFSEEFVRAHELTYIDPERPGQAPAMAELSAADQDKVKQRLKDLGYL